MSDDTDDDVPYGQPSSRRKSKKRILSSDSSSSCSSNSPILRTQRNAKYRVVSDDSESDSSDSFERLSRSRKRKKAALIMSDSEDDSDASDIIIVRRAKRVANIVDSEHEEDLKYSSSQWETDEGSDNEEKAKKNTQPKKLSDKESGSETDTSGKQSEECPICLVPIKKQELGTPESCDHIFCLACILEWSKNVNTCPIDRHEYKLVFVKDKINGKIIRRIPIEKPAPPGPAEDPICCEICGSGDREDRLLLCDGCDQGFHLECLTPPLEEVPSGAWFCNVCRPEYLQDESFEDYPRMDLFELLNAFRTSVNGGRRRDSRLIPRTRQTERVISRILNHRISTENNAESLEQPSNSQRTARRATAVQRKTTKRRKRKTYRKKYRMVYEIDEVTGDVVSKKKQVRVGGKRRTRKSRNKNRTPKPPKTVKKRLAQQLGICRSQLPNQNVPDVRIQGNTSGLNNQRYQAGIPTLHLFGQRDEIDYFSASDEEFGGPDYLVRRRANHSDVSLFRRAARRKGVLLPQMPSVSVTPSSSSDLLSSIMECQSKFFSKSAKLSVDNSGKLKIENNNNKVNSNNGKPDLKQFNNLTRKTPYGGNNRNNDKRGNQQPYSNSSYQGGSYYPYDSYGPSSTSENYRSYPNSSQDNANNTGGGYDQDMPQDYTQSTLSSYDRDIDFENNRNEQGDESDIDIYSDIEESVSTSKIEEDNSMKPLNLSPSVAPAPVPNIAGSDNENIDSDNEMVIDTEKVETPTQDEEEETVKEETAVTSSEDTVAKCTSTLEAPIGLHSTSDNQSEEAESSFNRSREDEDDEDEDGCPNFNIYSTESINLAKNTDITLNPEENNQVVSTTPLPEPPKPPPGLTGGDFDCFDAYDPDVAYDPEAAYNSEKESEAPQEDVYDPERVYDTPEDTCEPQKIEEPTDKPEEENHEAETPDNVEVPPEPKEESSIVESEVVDEQKEDIESDTKDEKQQPSPTKAQKSKSRNPNALYSDSEDEEVVKISQNSFIVGDISTMTEDVSDEERSYTPCLDEKDRSKGLDDLGTEMISDDEKNDFDESHEHKTASEGDALEINAKESEIDMVRPEDYEEGEIVDKNKTKKDQQDENANKENQEIPAPDTVDTEKSKSNKKDNKKNESKEKQESFKKLSKSNKERNYRDKDRSRSPGKADKSRNKSDNKEKRKDKRKEIERYDVRALIAEKPRRLKDKFGRDIRKSSSRSRSRSRSYTPKNSPERRTPPKRRASSGSRERPRKKRSRSRRKSSASRSKSRQRHRSLSKSRRRRSRSRSKRKKDRSKRRKRERSTSRTYTPIRKRRKDWDARYSRERAYSAEARWTPSLSRSPDPEAARHMSPSWTPPRVLESAAVDPRGLTVILQNDQNKKKKDKRKKNGKKTRESDKRTKRKKKENTPQPSKEVFASGDNILVSVSFNKENERRERDVFTKKKKEVEDKERKKRSIRRKKKNQELSTIKPVAIIDLERSPFRELTPSPKDVIVLSDEDHVENNANEAQDVCDSSQQVASPESVPVYMTGPKTPPEPQVKFSLPSKQPTLRPLINNPLHDPEDEIADDQEREEDQEMRELSDNHKGPNTPPEPPNSPPSSPDAYDPFEPTKSRSPSPEVQVTNVEEGDKRNNIGEGLEKSAVLPSMTPPIADVQPADSQSSLLISRDSSKSPEQVRSVQQSTIQSFTPASNALTSTPLPSSVGAQRINILSSTILGSVSSTIPQRATLPNVIKLSPVKISPVKNQTKPTPNKSGNAASSSKSKNKSGQQNGGNESSEVISLDFDSPYSPGSSDYEDLFEPPPEVVTKKTLNKSAPAGVGTKDAISSSKPKNTFDSLFDTPVNKMKKMDKMRSKKSKGTKIVGVKLDEDHLKILDELPNSAVEMQVKDKFLKKLNRQERVVEEVKLVLKPYYNKKKIDKEEYKDIMRRAVPKICHNKSGEINPNKIKNLVEAYVRKIRHAKPKVTSSSSYNPLKG